jgi:hypothetical protein
VGSLVDFLKRDEVRTRALDDPREARQIERTIHAFAVVNVVSEDANGAGSRRGRSRPEHSQEKQ